MERPEIRTDRLLIRPWRLTDIDDAFEYVSDPEWSRYMIAVNYPSRYEDTQAFVTRALEGVGDHGMELAIEFEGRVIGGIGLIIIDTESRTASLGYGIAREHWGKGFASEAARAVVAYGFEKLHLHRIFATADARNAGSVRVMQKLGMQQEAYLRQHRFYGGEYADEVWYAILAEEYFATGT